MKMKMRMKETFKIKWSNQNYLKFLKNFKIQLYKLIDYMGETKMAFIKITLIISKLEIKLINKKLVMNRCFKV